MPKVKLAAGRSTPAWTVRLALAGFGVLTILALGPGPAPTVLLSGFLLAVVIRPGTWSGCFYLLALAVIWLALATPALSVATVTLLGFGPATPALATVVDRLPLRARIEWRAFAPSLLRFLLIEVISQPLVLVAGALESARLSVLPVAIGGAVVLAVAAWLLLPRLSD